MIETTKCAWLVLTLLGGACAASGELASGFLSRDPETGAGEIHVTGENVQKALEDSGIPTEQAVGWTAVVTSLLGLGATTLAERRKASRKRGEMWAAIESAKKTTNGS